MKRYRYLLCLLLCAVMIYFALPRLSPTDSGLGGSFAIAWLVFAFLVLAGNLSALLFQHHSNKNSPQNKGNRQKRRIRAQ